MRSRLAITAAMLLLSGAGPATQPAETYPALHALMVKLQARVAQLEKENTALKKQNAELQDQLAKMGPKVPSVKDELPEHPKVGDRGKFDEGKVLQVIGPRLALVELVMTGKPLDQQSVVDAARQGVTLSNAYTVELALEIDTADMVDGQSLAGGAVDINGTYAYQSTAGGRRTVLKAKITN